MPAIDIERLVSCVYQRPAIWDTTHDAHHNRFILDKLWEEVAKEVHCSKVNVKSKWKYLRDNFRKELAKQPKSDTGETDMDNIRSSWPYFVSLMFLKDQFGGRKSMPGGTGYQEDSEQQMEYGDGGEDLSEMLEVSYEEDGAEGKTGTNSPGGSSSFLGEGSVDEGTNTIPTNGFYTGGRVKTASVGVVTSNGARKRPHNGTCSQEQQTTEISEELQNMFSVDRQRINRLIREKLAGGTSVANVGVTTAPPPAFIPTMVKPEPQVVFVDTTGEDGKFFESLLPHVIKIPPQEKLLFRSKIQNLVQEYAYRNTGTQAFCGGPSQSDHPRSDNSVSPQSTQTDE